MDRTKLLEEIDSGKRKLYLMTNADIGLPSEYARFCDHEYHYHTPCGQRPVDTFAGKVGEIVPCDCEKATA